jgi:hypothetical protein
MLCTACQNKPRCVAARLAQGDANLAKLLGQLKHCSLRSGPPTLGQRLRTLGHHLRALGHRLGNHLRPGLRA